MPLMSNIGAIETEAGYVTLKAIRNAQDIIRDLDAQVGNVISNGKVILDHRDLTNIGTNTHSQIDAHITNKSNPHTVTLEQAVSAGATATTKPIFDGGFDVGSTASTMTFLDTANPAVFSSSRAVGANVAFQFKVGNGTLNALNINSDLTLTNNAGKAVVFNETSPTFNSVLITAEAQFSEQSTPAASQANTLRVFADTADGHLKRIDDAGLVVDLEDTGPVVTGDDPTASVGLAAVNGVAATFLRSDGAPALDVGIAPTWTATHNFANQIEADGGIDVGATPGYYRSSIPNNGSTNHEAHLLETANTLSTTFSGFSTRQALFYICNGQYASNWANVAFAVFSNHYLWTKTGGLYIGASQPRALDGLVGGAAGHTRNYNLILSDVAKTDTGGSKIGLAIVETFTHTVGHACAGIGVNCEVRSNETQGTHTQPKRGGNFGSNFGNASAGAKTYSGAIVGGKFGAGSSTGTYSNTTTVAELDCGQFEMTDSVSSGTVNITEANLILANLKTGFTGNSNITTLNGLNIDSDLTTGSPTNANAIRIAAQSTNGAAALGNINMLGGDWNDGHLQLNTSHIWYDGATLRGKASAPTGAGDGVDLLTTENVNIDNTDSPYIAAVPQAILCDATSGAITVDLPAVASSDGVRYYIKKVDSSANVVTVDGSGAETIDGATTQTLASQYDSIEIVCDGTEWWIV